MNKLLLTVLGLASVLAATPMASAQGNFFYDEEPGPAYIGIDAGGVIMEDFKLTSFDGTGLGGVKASADPGFRFDLFGGVHFKNDFTVELNTGTVYNQVDKIGGEELGGDRLDIWQMPLMVNLTYTVPTEGPVTGFIGAGAGGVFTSIDFDLGRFGHFTDTDAAFGYQAFGGVKYKIGDWSDIAVLYRFMGTSEHSWSDNGVDLTANAITTHSILAAYTVRF